jgi:hypothetical protein
MHAGVPGTWGEIEGIRYRQNVLVRTGGFDAQYEGLRNECSDEECLRSGKRVLVVTARSSIIFGIESHPQDVKLNDGVCAGPLYRVEATR